MPMIMLQNINQPKHCNDMRLADKTLISNVVEATILTGHFTGEDVLIPCIPMIPIHMSFQFNSIPNSICVRNHHQLSSGPIIELCSLVLNMACFSHMLHVLESANQTISMLYRQHNNHKCCIPTSIAKLNILETCAFNFFLFHLIRMEHSNTWPGTASIYVCVCGCRKV